MTGRFLLFNKLRESIKKKQKNRNNTPENTERREIF